MSKSSSSSYGVTQNASHKRGSRAHEGLHQGDRGQHSGQSYDAKEGLAALLEAERDGQILIENARANKTWRLRQAKEEADREAAHYRAQQESESRKKLAQMHAEAGMMAKQIEAKTFQKLQALRSVASNSSAEVVKMIVGFVVTCKNEVGRHYSPQARERKTSPETSGISPIAEQDFVSPSTSRPDSPLGYDSPVRTVSSPLGHNSRSPTKTAGSPSGYNSPTGTASSPSGYDSPTRAAGSPSGYDSPTRRADTPLGYDSPSPTRLPSQSIMSLPAPAIVMHEPNKGRASLPAPFVRFEVEDDDEDDEHPQGRPSR